jgi:transcription elongation factor Elf1
LNITDLKYAGILSTRLERFSVKAHSPYRANFRCPICGDSQKNKMKARGWILEKENIAIIYCHNCNASHNMRSFLQFIDHNLFNEYVIDSAMERGQKRDLFQSTRTEKVKPLDTLKMKAPEFRKSGSPLLKIKKISQLDHDHKAKVYLQKRQILPSDHYKLYYAPKFNEWVNSIIPGKLPVLEKDSPRLIMPFIDKRGVLFGFNARAFGSSGLRYITIMLDDSMPKMFNLSDVDFSKKYYVTEGPIDSLFLSNAVAMAGADGNARGLESTENAVFIFDNEPRNKEIVARMEKCLDRGFKICIFPEKIILNDINDMILSGMNKAEVELLIDMNTYQGLSGKLQLAEWKKVC